MPKARVRQTGEWHREDPPKGSVESQSEAGFGGAQDDRCVAAGTAKSHQTRLIQAALTVKFGCAFLASIPASPWFLEISAERRRPTS